MERIILHSDCNSFYASVECLHHPEIREKPVAVGGDIEQRHGIILAKNQLAKQFHVSTGEAIWQAKQKCPELIVLPPDFPLYLRFSRLARDIYLDYSSRWNRLAWTRHGWISPAEKIKRIREKRQPGDPEKNPGRIGNYREYRCKLQ